MATRKIKVLSTVGVSGTLETNVTTLGELKPLLRQREINFDGMQMMVGETRNELNVDEAVLPEGDFKLYLMPTKTKSGSSNAADICYRIAELFEELGQELAQGGASASPVASAPAQTVDADVEDLRRLSGDSGSTSSEHNWL